MANKTISVNGDRQIFFAGALFACETQVDKEKIKKLLADEAKATPIELYVLDGDIAGITKNIIDPPARHLSKEGRKSNETKATVKPVEQSDPRNDIEPPLNVM